MAYNQSAVIGLGSYERGSEDTTGVQFSGSKDQSFVCVDLNWVFAGTRQATGQHTVHLTNLNERQARAFMSSMDKATSDGWAWINDKWGES